VKARRARSPRTSPARTRMPGQADQTMTGHRRVGGCSRCRSTGSWQSSPGAGNLAGTRCGGSLAALA
jgi:hypothetical protein